MNMEKPAVRMTMTITPELADAIQRLKKEKYYYTSYAEMYRQLLILGLEEAERRLERELAERKKEDIEN